MSIIRRLPIDKRFCFTVSGNMLRARAVIDYESYIIYEIKYSSSIIVGTPIIE